MTRTDKLTPEAIRRWLVDRVAFYLGEPSDRIDPGVSLAEHGLDSVYAFTLCGDIEDQLGLAVEPIVLWEADTIAALTVHLAQAGAHGRA
jgi:acyl carrier protein